MKNFLIQKYFNPETQKAQIEADVLNAYKRYPELKTLNLAPREVMARENALSTLDEYINNPKLMIDGNDVGISNFARSLFTFNRTQEILLSHIKHVRGLLLKPYDSADWSKMQRIPIQKVNPDKSIDFPQTYDTNMTYKMFLAKFVDNVSVILKAPTPKPNNVDGKTVSQLQEERKQKEAQLERNARLEHFILTLQGIDKGKNHKIYINAMDSLERGDYFAAKDTIGSHIKKEFDIDIENVLSSKESMGNTLRSLGLYEDAQREFQNSLGEKANSIMNESDKSKQKQVLIRYQDFVAKYQGDQNEINKKAIQAYDAYVLSLPQGSVEHENAMNRENEIKQNIATAMLVSSATNDFIEKNPDAKLLSEFEKIGDMNGIGMWDFSDKTVKITKEALIVVASFAATAGISALLTFIGGAARAAVIARSAQTMGKTGKAVTAGINAAGKTATAVNTVKKAGVVVGEALIFTTAESMLHSIFRSEGERSGFADFLENFAKNTAMFGAFAGMEKFVTGPIAAKFLKEGVSPSVKITLAQSAVLTAGDVAAMSTLHAIETGQSGLDGWESILVALAFRIGFKGVQNHFPNALAKFRSKPQSEQQQIIDDVADEIAGIKNLGKNSKNIISNEGMIARQEKLQKLQNPRRGDEIKLSNGEVWKYTGNNHRWQNNNGKYSTSQEVRKKIIQESQPNTKIQNQIDDLVGVNKSSPKMREKDFLTAEEVKKLQTQRSGQGFGENQGLKNAREKIAKEPDFISTETYAQKDLKNFINRNDLPVGTQIKVKIGDGKTTYISNYEVESIVNGKIVWKNLGGGHPFHPREMNGKYFINNAKNQQILNVELRVPNASKIERLKQLDDMIAESEKNRQLPQSNQSQQNFYSGNPSEANFVGPTRGLQDELRYHFHNPKPDQKVTLPNETIWTYNSKGYWELTGNPKNISTNMQRSNADLTADYARMFHSRNSKNPTNDLPIKTQNAKSILGNVPFWMKNIESIINKASKNAIDDLKTAMTSRSLEKLDAFFKTHWPSIIGGSTALKLLPYWLEQNKINPNAYVPDVMPTSVEEAKNICIECMKDVELPSIDYTRSSEANAKVILDEKRREAITARGVKTQEWQSAVTLWQELNTKYPEYFSDVFKEKVNIALTLPTVTNIQQLQNCIGMEPVDRHIGQDGIVGPITTQHFSNFLQEAQEQCTKIYGDSEKAQDSQNPAENPGNENSEENQSEQLTGLESTDQVSSDSNVSHVDVNPEEVNVPEVSS